MNNALDLVLLLCTFLLGLFMVAVWSFEIFAILHSRQEQDYFRKNPWFACLAFISSPVVLLLHCCAHLLTKLSHILRYILISLIVLLGILVSPAFMLGIPLGFLLYKLFRIAAPLGTRFFNLSLDFFEQLEFWFGGRKQERQP